MVERNIRTKRRTILYAVIAVFVLTAFSPGVAAAASPDWPFPRGDLNNTGYSDLEGNFTEPVKTWSVTGRDCTIGDIDNDGKTEAVTHYQDKILALNAKNGTEIWNFTALNNIVPDPVIGNLDDDSALEVAAISKDKFLYVLNGENGTLKWKYEVSDSDTSNLLISDINSDGISEVVLAVDHTNLVVLNGKDGGYIGGYYTSSSIGSPDLAISDVDKDGTEELVIADRYVEVLNGVNGSSEWYYSGWGSNVWAKTKPAIIDSGRNYNEIIVGMSDYYLYSLNGKNGSVNWKYRVGGGNWREPAVGDLNGDGLSDVVIYNSDGRLYAVNGKNGSLIWKNSPNYPAVGPVIFDYNGDGNNEVVITRDGVLYGNNGTSLKTYSFNWPQKSIGDIDNDGEAEILVRSTAYDSAGEYPTVSITSPVNSQTFTDGDKVHFNASASDSDGSIVSYEWSSSKEGVFGNSASLNYSDLSIGTHTVTATVTDDNGITASDSVVITVEKGENNATIDSFTSEKSTYSTGELAKFTVKTDVRYSGDYIVVVSGTESDAGEPVAGSSLLQSFQGTTTIPVYVSIPSNTGTGTYQMTAAVYSLDTSTGDVGDRIGVISPGQAIDVSVTK